MRFSSYWELSDGIGWVLERENPQVHLSDSGAEMSLEMEHLPEHLGNFKNPSRNVY